MERERHEQIIFPRGELKLHSMLINFGLQTVNDSSYCWDGMRRGNREFVIYQHTLEGEGMLKYNGELFPQTPGRTMLLIVPENHCYYFPEGGNRPWKFIYLTLYGAEVVRLAREYRRRYGVSPEGQEGMRPAELWRETAEIYDRGELTVSRASVQAYSFMLELLESTRGGRRGNPLSEQIRRYCLENLSGELSLEEMARHFHYSRSHFSRLFRECTGCSESIYVRDLRLRLALQLLQTTNFSIKEIAARCGFGSENYFCRVFKACYGQSPGAFRRET